MLNDTEFKERLEKIFSHYNLTPATFAEEIGVQRSSLSHLLSGRNKPSLDFILKIEQRFEAVDFYWLLQGKGSFPKNLAHEKTAETQPEKTEAPTPLFEEKKIVQKEPEKTLSLFDEDKPNELEKLEIEEELKETVETDNNQAQNRPETRSTDLNPVDKSVIAQVMFFYEDGTFERFSPKPNQK
jgi:transcriptional regulator with XRE-family HTH domain